MRKEEWNIPVDYDALIADGDTQYSIRGVETADNMESMRRFLDAVGVPSDKIELDYGTQVVIEHPDAEKVIVIDSRGLGDFFDSGFAVTICARTEAL